MAFYYGAELPEELLDHYDLVVVDPDFHPKLPSLAAGRRARPVAYVSIEEVGPGRSWARELPDGWLLGRNEAWGSHVVDVRQPGWREFMLARVLEPLWAAGYRAFFFDTLDSHVLALSDQAGREACGQAVAAFIAAAVQRFPGAHIVLNRGFELLPAVGHLVHGVVAESLFAGWDATHQHYTKVQEADRAWLLSRLQEARVRHGLHVTVIDYVPPEKKEKRREVARRIASLGFVPWVSRPALDDLGTGLVEVVPRRVLVVQYDGREAADLRTMDGHRLLAAPLEALGYAADYVDPTRGLPAGNLHTRYAGIATWMASPVEPSSRYRRWLLRQMKSGMRVAIFQSPGMVVDAELLGRLGLNRVPRSTTPRSVGFAADWVGFEAAVPAPPTSDEAFRVRDPAVNTYLRLVDAAGSVIDAVVVGPWGGMALHPFVLAPAPDGERRWVVDPLAFLVRALDLPALPVPDVATLYGRRVLTIEVEGDGFWEPAELPGTPPAAQVLHERILAKHPLPTTVAVVPGTLSGPARRRAAGIFGLPHVEPAAQPWEALDRLAAASPERAEAILGSVRAVQRLVPQDRRVQLLLWPSEAMPEEAELRSLRDLGLGNVNGSHPPRLKDADSLTRLTPLGAPVGQLFQVYAPSPDDWLYTGYWTGPFYGYRRAHETWQLDASPRLLRPLGLHYHFRSLTRPASVDALEGLYSALGSMELFPLWLSEYARMAESFGRTSLALRLDGGWELRRLGPIRAVRLPAKSPFPDLQRSVNVIGYRDLAQGRILHLGGSDQATLVWSAQPPGQLSLVQSNARVTSWQATEDGAIVSISGHLPIRFAVAAPGRSCELTCAGRVRRPVAAEGVWAFELNEREISDAKITCR